MPTSRRGLTATIPTRVVVDIGNSRIKWGLCVGPAVVSSASLPPNDAAAWQRQLTAWKLDDPLDWALASVHPECRAGLVAWLTQRGDTVRFIDKCQHLPLSVVVEHPDKVGIDRLLNAVAANTRRNHDHSAIIVDAGTAVTVDCLDAQGVFRGGAILPGLRLMAKALHDYTALLPEVEPDSAIVLPGANTTQALKAGIFCAVAGGIGETIRLLKNSQTNSSVEVFLTGGDAAQLAGSLPAATKVWPWMTLEGLRLAAWPTGNP